MDGITHYLTTDLDLYSDEDLTSLAAALDFRGLSSRGTTSFASGGCFFAFSLRHDAEYDEPEPQIAAMLTVVEGLDEPLRSAWAGCSLRVFDIGYDCGREPFALRQELSNDILARLAAAGATLRITLYADQEASPAESGPAPDPTGE